MQPIDAVTTNTTQPINSNNDHLEKLYSLYGPQMGLDRNRFIQFAQAHQANGGLLPSLSNNDDGTADPNAPMALAFMQRAKAAQRDQDYQEDMDNQAAEQELETEQTRAEEENRRAQAVAESQKLALEPKAEPEMGDSAFGQMIIRGGATGTQKSQQANAFLRGRAQRAQFVTGAQRRFQMPKVPGGQK